MTGRCISHREWKATQIFEADKISISNLNILANAGYDCWGRPKMQPIDITVTISLARDVSSAAAHDSVDDSTVHYGDLSKVIVARTKQHEGQWLSPDDFAQIILLAAIGSSPKPAAIAATQLTVHFPKSTLLGEGISLLLHHSPSLDITSPVLFLKNIRIPALIGVNAHERNQKQMVMISLWVDRLKTYVTDHSFEVEQIVVKTTEESSYETLESLSEVVAAHIIKYFIFAKRDLNSNVPESTGVRVKIEKPNAVPMADSPAVEIYRNADPEQPFGKRMMSELGSKRPQIPYPLKGRLDEFLNSWKQD